MVAQKLQTKIDRTLKTVVEGVELLDNIYNQMQAATLDRRQKEMLEMDLKMQVKKLQRLRDQIKTWVASDEIEDKSQLVDKQKLIDTQTEKFKVWEEEMRTKALSGLTEDTELDPKEEEALWLQRKVEQLQIQIEQAEAEIQSLQRPGEKVRKAAGRLETLEYLNERRRWHVSRLEIALRLLQNGSLSPEESFALHDDVSYFIESNTKEDFDEDEGMYDHLYLDEEEEKFCLPVGEATTVTCPTSEVAELPTA